MFTEILHVSISKFVHVRKVLSYTSESISQLKSSFFILAGVIKNYWLVFKIKTVHFPKLMRSPIVMIYRVTSLVQIPAWLRGVICGSWDLLGIISTPQFYF